MTAPTEPAAILSHLYRTDGSATFSQNGYSVIGAVNGPLEVTRRDELPEEAAIEVNVRPASGVGGTRERHLESILQSTLRQIILVHSFPRSLIQITLQITSTAENETTGTKLSQASSNLPILPALLQTAIMTLLSASMPLSMTLTATLLALVSEGSSRQIVRNPTPLQSQSAASLHVLAFSSQGKLLVAESEGNFSMDDWEAVYEAGKSICCDDLEDEDMDDEDDNLGGGMNTFVRSALLAKVTSDLNWKD